MKSIFYLPALLLTFLISSCGSTMDGGSNELTATVNGEEWKFFDAAVERSGDELTISGRGYLGGDEATEPMNLQITVVGVPEQEEISAPLEVSFAPNTEGVVASATVIPADRPLVFDTKLDANAEGRMEITEADGNTLSGTFNFVAKDNGGSELQITNGAFNNLPY